MRKLSPSWMIAAGLIATAVIWRMINWNYSIAPNLEIVSASALVAAVFLSRRAAIVVPLTIMAISDILIGNSMILIFTWSAFAFIGLAGLVMRPYKAAPAKLMVASVGAAIGGSVFFFLYTNFGVWLQGDGVTYAKTWAGLMQCYAMGLPFYRTMILGNVVFVPLYLGVSLLVSRAWAGRKDVLPVSVTN